MSYEIDYSVVIRTIGTAGAKYTALLESIRSLEPQPKEVIVVLPEGYEKPDEQLGYETFYFSPKGMVAQRMFGINATRTKYALVCDDDVSFDMDFVQKLYAPIHMGLCKFSAGPLLSFLPPKGVKTFISTLMGAAAPTVFHKERYVSLLRTSGYSFNRHIDTQKTVYLEALSLPWTCFFADVGAFKQIDLSSEVWLDANGYSAIDDQTMFYKGYLLGLKTIVVSDATYIHLDAKTSTRKNKTAAVYSSEFNRYVFWHRFIFSKENNSFMKLWSRICFNYRLAWIRAFNLIDLVRNRLSKNDLKLIRKALKDAKSYVKSQEYSLLPKF